MFKLMGKKIITILHSIYFHNYIVTYVYICILRFLEYIGNILCPSGSSSSIFINLAISIANFAPQVVRVAFLLTLL